jgi:hypothetical protein
MAETTRRYVTVDYELPPGGGLPVNRTGTFITCLAATAPFHICIDDAPPSEFMQGLTFKCLPSDAFQKIRLENPGANPIFVSIAIGYGEVIDARASFADAIPVGSAPNFISGPDVSCDAGQVTLLAAADPDRREIIIKNRSVNAREIRIGDTQAGATEGHEIAPGETFRMNVSGAVYVYNPHSAAVSVSVTVITG